MSLVYTLVLSIFKLCVDDSYWLSESKKEIEWKLNACMRTIWIWSIMWELNEERMAGLQESIVNQTTKTWEIYLCKLIHVWFEQIFTFLHNSWVSTAKSTDTKLYLLYIMVLCHSLLMPGLHFCFLILLQISWESLDGPWNQRQFFM